MRRDRAALDDTDVAFVATARNGIAVLNQGALFGSFMTLELNTGLYTNPVS